MPRRIERNVEQIFRLRQAGLSFRNIAKQVGMSHEGVRFLLKKHFGLQAEPKVLARELRERFGLSYSQLGFLRRNGIILRIRTGEYSRDSIHVLEEYLKEYSCLFCQKQLWPLKHRLGLKYCSESCMEKYSYHFNPEYRAKKNAAIKHWKEKHSEAVRRSGLKASHRYQWKIRKDYKYLIIKTCGVPKGEIVLPIRARNPVGHTWVKHGKRGVILPNACLKIIQEGKMEDPIKEMFNSIMRDFQDGLTKIMTSGLGDLLQSMGGVSILGKLAPSGIPQIDAYQILGLDKSASDDEVKKRYLDIMQRLHPDVAGEALTFLATLVNISYEMIKKERGIS